MPYNNNNNASGPKSKQKCSTKQRHIVHEQMQHSTRLKGRQDSNLSEDKMILHDRNERFKSPICEFDGNVPIPKLSIVASSLIVAVLSLISYWNSIYGEFVFDDLEAVIKNRDVKTDTPLWPLFFHDFWGDSIASNDSHKSYRPFTVISFRLNYYLAGGLHPLGFHLVNILLHTLVSVLVLPVSSALLVSWADVEERVDGWYLATPRASLLCAILFAVHPVHTENVAGIVGRADLLCALFFLLSFLMYASACRHDFCVDSSYSALLSSFRLLLSMVLCAVAMLCKEQGVTVIGVCSVFDCIINCRIDPIHACLTMCAYLQRHRLPPPADRVSRLSDTMWIRRLLCRQLLLLVTAILLLSFRFVVMAYSAPTFRDIDNPASYTKSIWVRVINHSYIHSLNAWLLLNPWWLCFDWSMGCVPLIQRPLDLRMAAPVTLWMVVACLVYQSLAGRNHVERRILTISLTVLVVPFLPASNLLFQVGFVIAERVLYLPSLGFCLLVVMGTKQLCMNGSHFNKRVVQGLLLMIVASHVTRCIRRNQEWQTEGRLYHAGLNVCPLNAKVHYNIGKSSADLHRTEEAIAAYREALRLHPDYEHALNNLGNLLGDLNQTEEAEELISKALTIRPTFAAAWMNLGIIQASLHKHREAEQSYLTALSHRRHYPDCYFNLGNLYLAQGDKDLALSAWLNATSLHNTHTEAWSNALLLLDTLGQFNTAVAVGYAALKHLPREAPIYYAVGNVLGKLERFEEAEQMFLKAIHHRPGVSSYHGNLGVLYHRWGKLDKAQQCYERSLTLNPFGEVTTENLQKLERTLSQRGKL